MHMVVNAIGTIADFMASLHARPEGAEQLGSAYMLTSFYARSIVLESFSAIDTMFHLVWGIKPTMDFGPDVAPAARSNNVHWFGNMYARCIRALLPVMDAVGKADMTHVGGDERPDAQINVPSTLCLMESVYRR